MGSTINVGTGLCKVLYDFGHAPSAPSAPGGRVHGEDFRDYRDGTGWGIHDKGPPFDSVQLPYKWLNSTVYGRYNMIIHDITIVNGVYIPTNITGGHHPVPSKILGTSEFQRWRMAFFFMEILW